MSLARVSSILILSLILTACGGGGLGSGGNLGSGGSSLSPTPQHSSSSSSNNAALSDLAALGKQIFFDPSLSASGVQSCGTCHVPSRAHASNDDLPVPIGGANFNTQGFRNTPALNYLQFNPAFFFNKAGVPTGGFSRDGRANTFAIQAERPFLAAHEMANGTAAKLAEKLERTAYVSEFRRIFGASIFSNSDDTFARATLAIAAFEKEAPEFHPFDSKYDAFLAGKTNLTEQELRGFALFNDPRKGNCAGCHPSTRANGQTPLFTDFTYDNLGIPRNTAIAATADPSYFDLGLCGPDRTDLTDRSDLCGAFKVPSLRNVAITAPYFHNGKFNTLRDVVSFYVRRDTNPDEWYPNGASGIEKFNDLPPAYRKNVNTTEAPYNRKLGEQPALDSDEIDAVVAFLTTLTDGYLPQQ
jgi:cytochrome c peroxidase